MIDYGVNYDVPHVLAVQRDITISCLPDQRIAKLIASYVERRLKGTLEKMPELEEMEENLTIPEVEALDNGSDPLSLLSPSLIGLLHP